MSRFVSVHAGGCGDPGAVSDGVIPTVSGTAVGDTVTYTCQSGYTLSGNSTRTCQPNGSWSDNAPKCISKYCIVCMCRVQSPFVFFQWPLHTCLWVCPFLYIRKRSFNMHMVVVHCCIQCRRQRSNIL